MLSYTLPHSLDAMLGRVSAGVMTPASSAMFAALVVGSIRQTGERTVCGMLKGAGLAGRVRHQRAHRFLSHARWSERALGLAAASEAVATLDEHAPVEVVVDGSLYRRWGRKVAGCGWYHDPTANADRPVTAWGNSFVIASILTRPQFMQRPVALPVLATMHDKHAVESASHSALARDQLDALLAEFADRRVHGVGDAEFACTATMRDLSSNATFTSRLKANAALYDLKPPPPGGRGRPPEKGDRLDSLKQIAHDDATTWHNATVERYGTTDTVLLSGFTCLWWGVTHKTPVRVVLLRDPAKPTPKGYQIAVVSTDLDSTGTELVERYARRWPCETSFQDGKNVAGVGDPQNRHPNAVHRTIPFQLIAMTLTILWYIRHLHHPDVVADARARAPWWTNKRAPSVTDMYHAARRLLIAAEFRATSGTAPNHQQIREVTRAWELAAA